MIFENLLILKRDQLKMILEFNLFIEQSSWNDFENLVTFKNDKLEENFNDTSWWQKGSTNCRF